MSILRLFCISCPTLSKDCSFRPKWGLYFWVYPPNENAHEFENAPKCSYAGPSSLFAPNLQKSLSMVLSFIEFRNVGTSACFKSLFGPNLRARICVSAKPDKFIRVSVAPIYS